MKSVEVVTFPSTGFFSKLPLGAGWSAELNTESVKAGLPHIGLQVLSSFLLCAWSLWDFSWSPCCCQVGPHCLGLRVQSYLNFFTLSFSPQSPTLQLNPGSNVGLPSSWICCLCGFGAPPKPSLSWFILPHPTLITLNSPFLTILSSPNLISLPLPHFGRFLPPS